MVLLFNDFPPPLFHPENVFSTLFPGSVFTPASLLHNSQVRCGELGTPGVAPHSEAREGLGCRVLSLTHPYYGENSANRYAELFPFLRKCNI